MGGDFEVGEPGQSLVHRARPLLPRRHRLATPLRSAPIPARLGEEQLETVPVEVADVALKLLIDALLEIARSIGHLSTSATMITMSSASMARRTMPPEPFFLRVLGEHVPVDAHKGLERVVEGELAHRKGGAGGHVKVSMHSPVRPG